MPKAGSPAYLARRYSYPGWLASSLVKWLGEEEAETFCHNSHLVPPVTILANTHKTSVNSLAERFRDEGVDSMSVCSLLRSDDGTPRNDEGGSLLGDFLAIRNTGDISKLSAFCDGLFIVMDPGAIFAVSAMDLKPGQTIIDLCAAPGGKSFASACKMCNTGRVLAFDIHPHRTSLISDMQRRLGLTCITPQTKDATVHDPRLDASADAVLLDAPCSGFGTIRKRPEIKYNRTPQDITALAEKQRQMLSIGAKYVKPGGVLVYSTCTVAREENIGNIRWFLHHHPFEMRPLNMHQYREIRFVEEDNCVQILPGPANDGFFVAAMVKNSL